MTMNHTWHTEYSIETNTTPETVWQLFLDVNGWKTWNSGVEEISIEGPFANGTWFTMKPPGQEAVRSKLIEVQENEVFVDETQFGDVAIWVEHRLEQLGAARTRIRYAIKVDGPDAAAIGQAISADFPDVLAALAKLAQQRSVEGGR